MEGWAEQGLGGGLSGQVEFQRRGEQGHSPQDAEADEQPAEGESG